MTNSEWLEITVRLPVGAIEDAARRALDAELHVGSGHSDGAMAAAVRSQVRRAVERLAEEEWVRELVDGAVRSAVASVAGGEAVDVVKRAARMRARQLTLGGGP